MRAVQASCEIARVHNRFEVLERGDCSAHDRVPQEVVPRPVLFATTLRVNGWIFSFLIFLRFFFFFLFLPFVFFHAQTSNFEVGTLNLDFNVQCSPPSSPAPATHYLFYFFSLFFLFLSSGPSSFFWLGPPGSGQLHIEPLVQMTTSHVALNCLVNFPPSGNYFLTTQRLGCRFPKINKLGPLQPDAQGVW